MNDSKIKSARKAAKITQEELAKQLGVNRATISKYESGAISPSVPQLMKIATILNVSVHSLMDGMVKDWYAEGVTTGIELADWDHHVIDTLWEDEGYQHSDAEIRMINAFSKLNDEGQQKAIERTEELLEVPRYQKKKESPEE